MMNLLRPLFEAWLYAATQGPLAPWKRRWLKRALAQDAGLRRLAVELATFSHQQEAPAADKAPDLRPRLRALAAETPVERPLFPNAWVPAGAIAFLLLLALVALLQQPAAAPPAPAIQARALRDDDARALALPTASPTAAITAPAATTQAAATAPSATAAAASDPDGAAPGTATAKP